jgi:disease resistance protein RPS2
LSGESGKGVGICGRVPVDVKAAAYQAMHKKQNAFPPIDHAVPNVEAQRIEQEGRDLPDMAMEDRTESTRWEEIIEELMVINEAGDSQGQGVYEDMLDTENPTQSRTVEGIELIDQVRVYEEQELLKHQELRRMMNEYSVFLKQMSGLL